MEKATQESDILSEDSIVSIGMRKEKFEKDLNYTMKLFRITQEG
jgi:ornithine carbamoyltransferase